MKTLLLFIDGLGIGPLTQDNPFSFTPNLSLYNYYYGHDPSPFTRYLLDTTLNIEGLPQSGTGQVAILTGKNAPSFIGKHHGPFPHTTLRPWLKTESIGAWCNQNSFKWDLLNVYPDQYFEALKHRKIRLNAFGFMQTLLGKPLLPMSGLFNRKGFPASLSFSNLPEPMKLDSPKTMVEICNWLIDQFDYIDFGIIDYFFLDYAGHDKNLQQSILAITSISEFLDELIKRHLNLIIVSDHGNAEDCSTNRHTLNPVPMLVNFDCPLPAKDLTDVKSFIEFSLKDVPTTPQSSSGYS